jgi:PhnB protein
MMVENPPAGYQRIIPYLMYADAAAAIDFLCEAFGFEERFRLPGPGGVVGHAEIGYQDNVVMLANVTEQTGHASPRDLPARHGTVLCYVDDVDGHYERAKAAGAKIVAEPEDKYYGDRMYSAADPEGHQWFFATHTRDVPLEEMMPPEA